MHLYVVVHGKHVKVSVASYARDILHVLITLPSLVSLLLPSPQNGRGTRKLCSPNDLRCWCLKQMIRWKIRSRATDPHRPYKKTTDPTCNIYAAKNDCLTDSIKIWSPILKSGWVVWLQEQHCPNTQNKDSETVAIATWLPHNMLNQNALKHRTKS